MSKFLLGSMFQSLMGPVESESLWGALALLLKGMGGILLVMVLIFLVIVILNKAFSRQKKEQDSEEK